MFLLYLALIADTLPYPSWLSLTDETELRDGGIYLQKPVDALACEDRLIVVDLENHLVLIVTEKGVKALGGRGGGPGFFRNHPERVVLSENRLDVYEFNFYEVNSFSLDGRFLSKQKVADRSIARRMYHGEAWIEKRLVIGDDPAFYTSFGCSFGEREDEFLRGISPLSATFTDTGEIIMVSGRGVLALVDRRCQVTDILALPTLSLAIDPEVSDGAYYSGGKKQALYHGGVPVIGLAARSTRQVWVLARDERSNERVLFEANLDSQSVNFRLELEETVDRVLYSNGTLILLSQMDATVRAFRVTPLGQTE